MNATNATINMKGLLKALRRKWIRGHYTKFDKMLAQTANCDLETAQRIRQSWEDLNILGYDYDGFLCWYRGGF